MRCLRTVSINYKTARNLLNKISFQKIKMANRDNFNKPTIEALAKRVGYICSNPNCKNHTSGPNDKDDKFTLIGVAAHITAAAAGGPRFDYSLTPQERKGINNGIWLCGNCATLIDKDEVTYPVELVKSWKQQAELEMRKSIEGQPKQAANLLLKPFIEADLIWNSSWRLNKGFSARNRDVYGDEPILVGSPLFVFWELDWQYSLAIYNNSSSPAFNIKVEQDSKHLFYSLTKLPKINNLPAFANINLEAKTRINIEDVHTEADKLLESHIPEHLEGIELTIIYQDENRTEHKTLVTVEDGEIVNRKLK